MGENFQIHLIEEKNIQTTNAYILNRFVTPSQILELVSQYGTPLYLIDENTLHLKTNELLNAYEKYKQIDLFCPSYVCICKYKNIE